MSYIIFYIINGYSDKDIEMTELCVKGKDGKYYDFFRKRLMFPIMNVSGKVMAFGGRKYGCYIFTS